MTWIALSIAAALVWAVSNILDKIILERWKIPRDAPLVLLALLGGLISILLYLFGFASIAPTKLSLLALGNGAIYTGIIVFYFLAVRQEEISRVIPLFYLAPLFIAGLSALVLGERLAYQQYLGVLTIVIGAYGISTRNLKKPHWGPATGYMILSAIAATGYGVLTKYLVAHLSPWSVFAYCRVGMFFLVSFYLLLRPKALANSLRECSSVAMLALSLSLCIGMTGAILLIYARETGSATLVEAVSAIQPLIVLCFALLLSRFKSKFLREDLSKGVVVTKVIAITLLLIGNLLVTSY